MQRTSKRYRILKPKIENPYCYLRLPNDVIARLEANMRLQLDNHSSASSTEPSRILSYQEEIELLESALSVLTHSKIPQSAFTLDTQHNNNLVAT